jgi:pyrimidine-nucleoside phosphorylase
MRTVDVIILKRDGKKLSAAQIASLVSGFCAGTIPDYQIAAFLMAVVLRSMDDEETLALTRAIAHSGTILDFSDFGGPVTDKHSTGGVGDKTSLILAPLVASCGVFVPMISGRGLGHTGGTLDKLEAIPGFRTNLSLEEFKEQVRGVGVCLIGANENLAPADKKLYALRDVTGTVESLPLLISSIISKKIAGGSPSLVLDIKTGAGAFIKSLEGSRALARGLVAAGCALGCRTTALITDMGEPLGHAVGNANEVVEAVEVLRGGGPDDLREVSLELAAEMLLLAGTAPNHAEALARLNQKIVSGDALEKMREMITAQGGDASVLDDDLGLPMAAHRLEVKARAKGFVQTIQADFVGRAAMLLGAGRETANSTIDPAAGIWVRKKSGEPVDQNEPYCTLEFNDDRRLKEALALVEQAFSFGSERPAPRKRVLERLG